MAAPNAQFDPMGSGRYRYWLPALAMTGLCAVVYPAAAAPADATVAERPREILSQIGITPRLGAEVPLDAGFVDHRGRPVRLAELIGDRPVVLALVYFRCPMLCNMTADGLVRSLRELPSDVGREFDVAMVSFDPREGPAQAAAARRTALERYARPATEAGWHVLTGRRKAIGALTDAVGFRYRWDESSQQFAHAAGLILLTPQGRVSGYLDGVRFPPAELGEAIRRAGSNDVASASPQSFLRCYLYDPATGRFGKAVQWTARGLGAATVLGLGLAVGRMLFREKRSGLSHSDQANR